MHRVNVPFPIPAAPLLLSPSFGGSQFVPGICVFRLHPPAGIRRYIQITQVPGVLGIIVS